MQAVISDRRGEMAFVLDPIDDGQLAAIAALGGRFVAGVTLDDADVADTLNDWPDGMAAPDPVAYPDPADPLHFRAARRPTRPGGLRYEKFAGADELGTYLDRLRPAGGGV